MLNQYYNNTTTIVGSPSSVSYEKNVKLKTQYICVFVNSVLNVTVLFVSNILWTKKILEINLIVTGYSKIVRFHDKE